MAQANASVRAPARVHLAAGGTSLEQPRDAIEMRPLVGNRGQSSSQAAGAGARAVGTLHHRHPITRHFYTATGLSATAGLTYAAVGLFASGDADKTLLGGSFAASGAAAVLGLTVTHACGMFSRERDHRVRQA